MASELWLVRRMGHLVPANAQSAEALDKLPIDKWLLASIRQPRNVKFLRKWMALQSAVFPHQDEWPTFESFKRAIKKALGLGEWVVSKSGRREFLEGSVSFAKMTEDEFAEFYERGVQLILTRILPGVNREDLDLEVNEILEGRRAA